jgi:Trk K+ transport system NAD-binding subunit
MRPAWGGRRIDQLPLREAGCSLIAVERGGERIPIAAATQLAPEDVLWLCGTTDALQTITSGA